MLIWGPRCLRAAFPSQAVARRKLATPAVALEQHLRASFNYCAGPASEVLVSNPFEGTGFQENEAAGAIETVAHPVCNGRLDQGLVASSGASLEKRGFTLLEHASRVSDFYSETEVRETYYPELLAIAKRLCGTDKAIVVSHVLRQAARKSKNPREGSVRGAAYFVHNDFSNSLKEQFLQMYAAGHSNVLSEAPMLLSEDRLRRGRLMMVNIWRPLDTVRYAPLAVADATSLNEAEMHDYAHSPKELPASYALPVPIMLNLPSSSPNHRWYYFPEMTRDECLVFKTYDSRGCIPSNGVSIHSAFDLEDDRCEAASMPDAEEDSRPLRESVEARILCFSD